MPEKTEEMDYSRQLFEQSIIVSAHVEMRVFLERKPSVLHYNLPLSLCLDTVINFMLGLKGWHFIVRLWSISCFVWLDIWAAASLPSKTRILKKPSSFVLHVQGPATHDTDHFIRSWWCCWRSLVCQSNTLVHAETSHQIPGELQWFGPDSFSPQRMKAGDFGDSLILKISTLHLF